ncbi:MAG: hypothetical protein VB080_14485 [Propionicimonas sp.]|uniref:hypothetical protein n=1 Tax=Propionicimonas sp. TaxID=1955623 RepID=UPI002B1EE566|nr:hypothetical protein [Propionicimonas sp.]MEA4945631.1 hypothetical protein [Propionicimonas sp.]MEA5054780.1 hypothetical protein [Propionicimonas sp.]
MPSIYHIAIADDWEPSLRIASYEAATRGVLWEPGDHIRAVTAAGVQDVLDRHYQDLDLPLLLVELDPEGLAVAGVDVEQDADSEEARVLGPIPSADPAAVVSVRPLKRVDGRWRAPGL